MSHSFPSSEPIPLQNRSQATVRAQDIFGIFRQPVPLQQSTRWGFSCCPGSGHYEFWQAVGKRGGWQALNPPAGRWRRTQGAPDGQPTRRAGAGQAASLSSAAVPPAGCGARGCGPGQCCRRPCSPAARQPGPGPTARRDATAPPGAGAGLPRPG